MVLASILFDYLTCASGRLAGCTPWLISFDKKFHIARFILNTQKYGTQSIRQMLKTPGGYNLAVDALHKLRQ